uniref:PPIase cyclophilin-type domain-containing protein n=1 Tax=Ascaris lumbricoides TaxID=6252 RepID=A0A0M3ICH8_ASCLU
MGIINITQHFGERQLLKGSLSSEDPLRGKYTVCRVLFDTVCLFCNFFILSNVCKLILEMGENVVGDMKDVFVAQGFTWNWERSMELKTVETLNIIGSILT